MAKVTGIGGVFLKHREGKQRLIKWYEEKLNITVSEYGLSFLEPNVFTLITFDRKRNNEAILNFTVDNLDELMEELKAKDVTIVSEVKEYSYGKFSHIKDILGNVVELWEPYPEEYLKMVEDETKKYKK
jgi:predicted enzyme related to lactoylglutathione lyase